MRPQLPDGLRAAIDLLVEVPEGDARSSLFRLKDYPENANAGVIKGDIARLHLIEELLANGADLRRIDPMIIRQLGNSAAATTPATFAALPSPNGMPSSPAI